MEVLAIFGIACNVLQVLGSVEQAIKLGRVIYKDRSADPELARNVAALNTCMRELSSSLQSSADATTQDTKDLVSVARECLDCGAKTEEQLQKISNLAPGRSRFGALRAWSAAVTGGKRKLDELEHAMRARQHVLETQILVRICKKSDAMTISSRDSFDSLNSTLQSFILDCMQGQMTLENIMKSQFESIKVHVAAEKLIHRSAYTFLRESALARQILHPDRRTAEERRRALIGGVLAYTLVCAKPTHGSDGDTLAIPADDGSVGCQSANSLAARACSTLQPLSFKLCVSQDAEPCYGALFYLQFYAANRQLPDSEVRDMLSLAQIAHRSGRWPWVRGGAMGDEFFGLSYWNEFRDPDFLGGAASLGFLDYAWATMQDLYAASPAGMKVSTSYEDYILKAVTSNKCSIWFQPLSALRLMELMAGNMRPAAMKNSMSNADSLREKRRFQISSDVFPKISNYFEQLPSGRRPDLMHRALLGLFYAGYSDAGSMLVSLRRRLVAPKDHYDISGANHIGRRIPNEMILNEKGSILIHTNAKTILLLFLAWVHERLADGSSIFSELVAAAEKVNMPFLFRLVALQPHAQKNEKGREDQDEGAEEYDESAGPGTWEALAGRLCRLQSSLGQSFWIPVGFCESGRDAKTYEYRNLDAIRQATVEATGNKGGTLSSIVVPGLDDYARRILPELREVSSETFEKLLVRNGLVRDEERHGAWPPQTYSPIDVEL